MNKHQIAAQAMSNEIYNLEAKLTAATRLIESSIDIIKTLKSGYDPEGIGPDTDEVNGCAEAIISALDQWLKENKC